ncbi:MAG: hypothetical protein K2N72_14020 [Oscillospiraceae bacterium]|nr:hypothetical protein [Oscillospiraceae bacterium]
MKINKIIAFALACTLAAGSFEMLLAAHGEGNAVYARAERVAVEKSEAKKIKAEVLKRAEIPEGYTQFSCEAAEENGNIFYNLIWKKKYSWISVGYHNGLIYGYSTYSDYDSSKPSFAPNTEAEQEKIAYEHICRLNPDMRGKFELVRQNDYYDLSRWTEYRIYRVEKGISVDNSGRIIIDRSNGELIDFYLNEWYQGATFPDTKNILTMDEARGIYSENAYVNVKYELFYNGKYDPDSRTTALYPYVLPVYTIKNSKSEIDALTGETSSYSGDLRQTDTCWLYSWGRYGDADDVETCRGLGADDGEITDIDEYDIALYEATHDSSKYMTAKKAEEILAADGVIVFDGRLALKEEKITYGRDNNAAVRALRYVEFEYDPKEEPRDKISLWAELDAFSGEIAAFGKKYYYNEKSKEPLDEKSAAAAAKKAVAHFMGSRAAEYRFEKLTDDRGRELSENAAEGTAVLVRYINGLPADFDKAYVKVDSRGEVLGFEYTYSNAEIPRGRVMSREEALENFFKQQPPYLGYVGFTDSEMKPHIYLTYNFWDRYMESYYMDAITGERYNEYGRPYPYYEEAAKEEYYTDVSGHKYEKEIRELFRYGVRLGNDERLRPDDPITVYEFIELCWQTTNINNISSNGVYDYIETTDPETGETHHLGNPKNKEPLTYGGLARLFVRRYEDSKHSPSLNANYKQPYKNVTKDNPDYAYIAIAKKQGYISKGDEFDYNKTLTRGECMKIIYDYIASDGDKKLLYEIFKI